LNHWRERSFLIWAAVGFLGMGVSWRRLTVFWKGAGAASGQKGRSLAPRGALGSAECAGRNALDL
jgi:hypothetical protein